MIWAQKVPQRDDADGSNVPRSYLRHRLFHLCHLWIDSTSWTRRLVATADGVNGSDFHQWTYDRFGSADNAELMG